MTRSRLGPLAIESKLGDRSSPSSVWRAIHVKLKKSVAVKIFNAPFGGTPEARQAFSQEWESLKAVQHPAIIQCYGGGFEGTDAYLAYELIEGDTLGEQIERRTRLPWETVLEIAEPIADALEYLHQQKLVHGNIQPDKIVIAGLSPILLDMRMNRSTTPYKTNSPITPQQLSLRAPELLANPQGHDAKTDLYSFGATLYWALTGDPPISGNSIEEVRGNIEYQEVTSPAQIVLDCPVWLDKLVTQLLQKDPVARPANASSVKLALAEVRKRAMSRTGVAEHVSSGFSPLQMTDQKERDEARSLLGRGVVDLQQNDDEQESDGFVVWHDQAPILIGFLIVALAGVTWWAWPASEESLRSEAERLIQVDTIRSLTEAEMEPLRQLRTRFPDGQYADWVQEQIEYIDVRQFLHQLSFKVKNNLPLKGQGEELHKQAQQFATLGDVSKALDKYKAIITILKGEPKYDVAVKAAEYQLKKLGESNVEKTETTEILARRLAEAQKLFDEGKRRDARTIWSDLVEGYGNSDNPAIRKLIDEARAGLEK